jgi:hypothetical protein
LFPTQNPDTIEIIGAVAQLGEHRVCNAGVASSNLVGSIHNSFAKRQHNPKSIR